MDVIGIATGESVTLDDSAAPVAIAWVITAVDLTDGKTYGTNGAINNPGLVKNDKTGGYINEYNFSADGTLSACSRYGFTYTHDAKANNNVLTYTTDIGS